MNRQNCWCVCNVNKPNAVVVKMFEKSDGKIFH